MFSNKNTLVCYCQTYPNRIRVRFHQIADELYLSQIQESTHVSVCLHPMHLAMFLLPATLEEMHVYVTEM